jgi:hypothetical protein
MKKQKQNTSKPTPLSSRGKNKQSLSSREKASNLSAQEKKQAISQL